MVLGNSIQFSRTENKRRIISKVELKRSSRNHSLLNSFLCYCHSGELLVSSGDSEIS